MKNLFEQFTLENGSRRPHAQTLPFLQQHNLVGIFTGEIQFVRNDHNGVTVFRSQTAEIVQQINLSPNVQMKRGLIQKQ